MSTRYQVSVDAFLRWSISKAFMRGNITDHSESYAGDIYASH